MGSLRGIRGWGVRLFGAALVYLVICEIAGLHTYVSRYSHRGNLPKGFYWSFQLVLLLELASLAWMAARGPVARIAFLGVGAIVAYAGGGILFIASLLPRFHRGDGPWQALRRLADAQGLDLLLWSPIFFLAPVFGFLLFGCYSMEEWLVTRLSSGANAARADGTAPRGEHVS